MLRSDLEKYIQNLIDDNKEESGYINIRKMSETLNIKIIEKELQDTTSVAVLLPKFKGEQKYLYLSSKFTYQEQNCALGWIIAEHLMLYPNIQSKDIVCTVFNLREFRQLRYSRTMLLTTRLLISEEAISSMCELDNVQTQRTLASYVTNEFSNSVVKGHSVSFLIGNLMI
jgi:hypothetical protein